MADVVGGGAYQEVVGAGGEGVFVGGFVPGGEVGDGEGEVDGAGLVFWYVDALEGAELLDGLFVGGVGGVGVELDDFVAVEGAGVGDVHADGQGAGVVSRGGVGGRGGSGGRRERVAGATWRLL